MKPLEVVTKLANNPTLEPQYKVKIRNLAGEEVVCADPRATRALVAIMDMHAVNGGAACHWGGPAGIAEAMSAAHALMFSKKPWYDYFNFVNDIGHAENGIYALRANYGFSGLTFNELMSFRSIDSKLTGHGESHLYPQGVLFSNGPLGSSLPQAQGMCMADRLAGNDRVTLCVMSDGACMEGEAKEALAALPGLAGKGKLNPFLLLVSDNNTKLSGRISEDSYSMQPSFSALKSLGWNVLTVDDGNDLQTIYVTLEQALLQLQSNRPTVIILKTIKGFGVKKTEESSSGGHGFPIKPGSEEIISFVHEIWGNETPKEIYEMARASIIEQKITKTTTEKEKIQVGIAKAMIESVENGKKVVSLSSDLQGSTGVADFHKKFPDLSFDLGIAEANMISSGAGFSKAGYIPVVDTFSAFAITKGNLPLIMASLSQAPLIGVFSHTGFQDAADGASHQSMTYFSAVANIPYLQTVFLSSSDEAYQLMKLAIERMTDAKLKGTHHPSIVFFLGRENFNKKNIEVANYSWGRAQVLKQGKDGILVSCGSMIEQTLVAAEILSEKGKHVTVINNIFANQFDIETFKHQLALNQASDGQCQILTVEDHQVNGGMGSYLFFELNQAGLKFNGRSLGVNGKFGQSAYLAQHLYHAHGLDADAIVEKFIQE